MERVIARLWPCNPLLIGIIRVSVPCKMLDRAKCNPHSFECGKITTHANLYKCDIFVTPHTQCSAKNDAVMRFACIYRRLVDGHAGSVEFTTALVV